MTGQDDFRIVDPSSPPVVWIRDAAVGFVLWYGVFCSVCYVNRSSRLMCCAVNERRAPTSDMRDIADNKRPQDRHDTINIFALRVSYYAVNRHKVHHQL